MQPFVCLLIDDDSEESEIFQYALEELKIPIECYVASSGKQALEDLKNHRIRPHYIFLDLNMPKMDGTQCLKEIKRLQDHNNIPVILYSTFFSEGQKETLKHLGADGFITKTTSIFELNSELSRIFGPQTDAQITEASRVFPNLIPAFELPKFGLNNN
jgi:CheY-like chemotaxis protein